jgi:hypothetical protein
MAPEQVLLILLLLFFKHFVVDFPLQAFPYQYKNKGTYGHPGGLIHSGLHAWATYLILFLFFDWPIAIMLGILDGFIHYHIDWAKMNLNKKLGYGPTTHEQFWVLLGLDQFLHALTYILIVFILL